jgi:hypothetical protein
MAAEVEKFSVFDPRIVQTKPKYAVQKGALAVSNVSFQAQTADSSSVQFNVQVPSENVFVDRAVEWSGSAVATLTIELGGPTAGDGSEYTLLAGTDLSGLIAPAAFPLHQAVSQMSATINDATVTVNTQDVLPQVLRLADMRDARRQRTCPTMLDRYAAYPDSSVVKNSPLLDWSETIASDNVPNGGFNGFYFATTATGATPVPLEGPSATINGVIYVNGRPTLAEDFSFDGTTTNEPLLLTFYVVIASVEKLLLPPFIFSDQYEMSTGLFGVQNFQVQMNMSSTSASRSFRASKKKTLIGSLGEVLAPVQSVSAVWSSTGAYGGTMWTTKPRLSVQFLTPALDVPLPPKSIVPYMEFPRYIATPATVVEKTSPASYATMKGTDLLSQTITLPSIPDLFLIYVKPSSYTDPTLGDFSLPIIKISMNFDNFSGLLSTMTQEQLYQMSLRNGCDMDWSEWSGLGRVPVASQLNVAGDAVTSKGGGWAGLAGGPLVLRPGVDFPLQTGQASGLVGNFTLQYTLTVQNYTGVAWGTDAPFVNIYTVPISSGFFETIKGSSRIIKGVLTEQDILSSPPQAPSEASARPVGAGRHGGHGQSVSMGRIPSTPVRGGMKNYHM